MSNYDVNSMIHSHDETAFSTVAMIEERRRGDMRGLRTYLGTLDNKVDPVMPGDLLIGYAMPGHVKIDTSHAVAGCP